MRCCRAIIRDFIRRPRRDIYFWHCAYCFTKSTSFRNIARSTQCTILIKVRQTYLYPATYIRIYYRGRKEDCLVANITPLEPATISDIFISIQIAQFLIQHDHDTMNTFENIDPNVKKQDTRPHFFRYIMCSIQCMHYACTVGILSSNSHAKNSVEVTAVHLWQLTKLLLVQSRNYDGNF